MPYGMGESKKKDAVWRQKEARIILFKFNAVAERRQWSSAASIPRRKSLAKLFPQLTQVKHAGFHQLAVGGKGRVVIAPAVVQDFSHIARHFLHNDLISHRWSPRWLGFPGR